MLVLILVLLLRKLRLGEVTELDLNWGILTPSPVPFPQIQPGCAAQVGLASLPGDFFPSVEDFLSPCSVPGTSMHAETS